MSVGEYFSAGLKYVYGMGTFGEKSIPNSQFLIRVDFSEILPTIVTPNGNTPCGWGKVVRTDVCEENTPSIILHCHDLK